MSQTVIALCQWCNRHAVTELVVAPAKHRSIVRHDPKPGESKMIKLLLKPKQKAWACERHANVQIAAGATRRRNKPGPEQPTIPLDDSATLP